MKSYLVVGKAINIMHMTQTLLCIKSSEISCVDGTFKTNSSQGSKGVAKYLADSLSHRKQYVRLRYDITLNYLTYYI